jgi:hypothetical protein
MAEQAKDDGFKTKVQKFIVLEKSFIDGTIREVGDVVDIVLGRPHDPTKHANLQPHTPEAERKMQEKLAAEAKEIGDAKAPVPPIRNA